MNEQAIRFRLGVFVLGSLILLGVLIILFGGFPGFFKAADSYTITFDIAPGVAPGTPVRRSGVRIGEVKNVTLDDDTGKVDVEISVRSEFSLRKQDVPNLVQGLIGGDSSIDFVPQPPGVKVEPGRVDPGSHLQGTVQADAGTLVQKTTDVMAPAKDTLVEAKKVFQDFNKFGPDLRKTNDEFQLTVRNWGKVGERMDVFLITNEKKITEAVTRLEQTLKRVGDTFNDENQKNLATTLKNVKNTSDKFDSLAKTTEEMLKDGQKTVQKINDSLRRSDQVLSNLEKTTKPMSEKSEKIVKNLEESTDKLNKALGEVRELMQVLARGDGTIQRLMSDPSLYNNLNDAACMVTRILPRVDRTLRDVEIFADKIARHPESLGLGGMIRPSTGLKEPPTAFPWKASH
jgi:phospholipid/cholesterol/gamma-HCH transport system substrate-binding protein